LNLSRLARITIAFLIGAAAFGPPAHALPPGSTPREIELGQEAAAEIAKAFQFLDDEEQLAKLQRMLDEIAQATPRPAIRYRPHIVITPAINAFVIPGGDVYVTTGLLAAVESDDELAGVLGHEIAHNVNQHAIKQMRNTPKGLGLLKLASLAALVLGGGPEVAILADATASMILASVLNGNTVEAEKEADADGLYYVTQTHYNPTGFLTFLEKLASSSGKFYEEELGIYRTHPLTRSRVEAARDRLTDYGVPIHRRLVTRSANPESRELVIDGQELTEIRYQGERVLLLAGHDEKHAAEVIASLRWALDYELRETEIKIVPAAGGVVLEPGEGPTCFLSAADGEANDTSDFLLGGKVRTKIADLVRSEQARIRANYQLY
jgi:Zn-dependent protease with chaperone function